MSHIKVDPDFWAIFENVIDDARAEGIEIVVESGYRSLKEQAQLYARSRAGKSSLPAARPGSSYHNYGLAIDISTSPPSGLQRVGEIAEDYGLRWGGHFRDPVHIDDGVRLTIAQARGQFDAEELITLED